MVEDIHSDLKDSDDFLTIPDYLRSIIFPDKNMSVSSLLLFRLPSPTASNSTSLHQYFSNDDPHNENSYSYYLRTQTTPAVNIVQQLMDNVTSAILRE